MRRTLIRLLVAGAAVAVLAAAGTVSAAPSVVSSGVLSLVIPESSGSSLENELSDVDLGPGFENAKITDVNLHLRIDHARDSDLDLWLTHDGVTVQVNRDNGDDGDNLGTGADCTNPTTLTRLDDEATTAMSSGTSPFAGSFQPDNPLSAFDGKPAEGDWTLKIVDDSSNAETGMLVCWNLEITVAVADLEVTVTDSPDPTSVGNELTYSATVKNLGPDKAKTAKIAVKLPTGAEFVADTPDTCGDVAGGELVCDLGDLDSGASRVIDIVVRPGSAGTASAFFSATSAAHGHRASEQQPGQGRYRRPGDGKRRHRDDHGRDPRRGARHGHQRPGRHRLRQRLRGRLPRGHGSDADGGARRRLTGRGLGRRLRRHRARPAVRGHRRRRHERDRHVREGGARWRLRRRLRRLRRQLRHLHDHRHERRRRPQGHEGHRRHLRPRRQRQAVRARRPRPDLRRQRQRQALRRTRRRQALRRPPAETRSSAARAPTRPSPTSATPSAASRARSRRYPDATRPTPGRYSSISSSGAVVSRSTPSAVTAYEFSMPTAPSPS